MQYFGVAITNVALLIPLKHPMFPPRAWIRFSMSQKSRFLNGSFREPLRSGHHSSGEQLCAQSTNTIFAGYEPDYGADTNTFTAPSGTSFAFGSHHDFSILNGIVYQVGNWPISISNNVVIFGTNRIVDTGLQIVLFTNQLVYGANNFALSTTNYSVTNQVVDLQSTNYLFGFEKAYYRVPGGRKRSGDFPYNWGNRYTLCTTLRDKHRGDEH